MKRQLAALCALGYLLTLGWLPFIAAAGQLQLVSLSPSQAPAGGGGDSSTPIISPDGRYVLFASTGGNLVLTTNGTPIPGRFPTVLNVFLRDRTNGTTALVSVALSGGGGNGDALPAGVSTNGRYALFESCASDLVPGDTNNTSDVFVRDLAGGVTTLVSANTNGVPGNGSSRSAAMTPDGRYIAFVSQANDLVPGDTNGIIDVFVHDLQTGVTLLASPGAAARSSLGKSDVPDITPDGRYVAFFSTAANLVPGVPAGGDIYVRDLTGGVTVWASTGARAALQLAAQSTQAVCYNHLISVDGQFVAYEASAQPGSSGNSASSGAVLRYSLITGLTDVLHTNAFVSRAPYEFTSTLDMTPDGRFVTFIANTNGVTGANTCVLLWDGQSGALTLLSGDTNNLVQANSVCDWPAIDSAGRFVAFLSSATNLTTNTLVGDYHLYLRDIQGGTTSLLDADTNGAGSPIGPAVMPRLSASGNLAVFEAASGSLVPNDRTHASDVFVRDTLSGGADLISMHDPALPSASPNGPSIIAPGAVNNDGRFVAFTSEADNLAPDNTNGYWNVFVADLAYGTNVLVSVATNGFSGDGSSSAPMLSPDGRYVVFTSTADNLVSGDTNRARDVFVRDLQAGTTTLVSVNSSGAGQGNGNSYAPLISAGGRYILFESMAQNLASGSFTGQNLFLRDVQLGVTYPLTTGGVYVASMTVDGRLVAFAGAIPRVPTFKLYVWDTQAGVRVYTNAANPVLSLAISPDGNRLAYSDGLHINVIDRRTGIVTNLGPSAIVSLPPPPRFSQDGGRLAFVQTNVRTNQVYLYDFRSGTSQLVSHRFDSTALAATGASDMPDLSADGRFVAYRSSAVDLVAGTGNTSPSIFLYDSQTGSNTLVNVNPSGNGSTDNRSLWPMFSGDGHTLLFESWESGLAGQDFNQASDLFAYLLLYAAVAPGTVPSQGPQVSWKLVPGASYRVQFKNTLADLTWQEAVGATTNLGNQAFFQDTGPVSPQKFYRVVSP